MVLVCTSKGLLGSVGISHLVYFVNPDLSGDLK